MKTLLWDKKEYLALGGILLLALFLRLVWIERVPPGVRYDELMNLKMAERVLAGERPLYFEQNWGHEPLYHYFQAIALAALGKTALSLRIISICAGVLSVLSTYLIARRLFGARVAVTAAALTAVSFWSLMLSRFGLRIVGVTPWMGLAVYAFWRALETPPEQRKTAILWFALCGLAQAAMLYTYFAGWMALALVVCFWGYLWSFHRPMLRGRGPGLALSLVIPLILIAPMIAYVVRHPEIGQRVGQVGSKLGAAWRSGDWGTLGQNAWRTLQMFSVRGDKEWLYNIRARPIFDPVTSALFYGGLLFSLWRWRRPQYAFIALWLAVGLAPTMLTWPAGSLPHSVIALAPTMILTALAFVAAWRWLCQRRLKWPGIAALIAVFALFTMRDGYDYFIRWPSSARVRNEYQAPAAAVARYLSDHPESGAVGVSAPFVDHRSPWSEASFNLLYHDHRPVRWFNGASSLLFPAGEQVRFVLPDHLDHPSELDAELGALLMAVTTPVEIGFRDEFGSTLNIYRLQERAPLDRFLDDCASMPAWSSPEGAYMAGESEKQRRALTLPLNLGHRLEWLGYRYAQTQAAPGGQWRVTTCWRVTANDGEPLALFIHLLDDENRVRASRDELNVSTASWRRGDVLIHVHILTLPPDMPSGAQRVELGVYSPLTMTRLPILTGEQAAPYNRALLRPLSVE